MPEPAPNPLQQKIGYTFSNPALLRVAVTHPSVAHEGETGVQHNQRLEFLGDSVLGLILTRELYEKFPNLGEGPLTKARAQLVNQASLADRARFLDLGAHLILSHSEATHGGRERASALADAFEALVGAIFMDGGYQPAADFVLRCFHGAFNGFHSLPQLDNPKGELQETLQSTSPEPPQYKILSATGPDHERHFECAVCHAGRELGRGAGKSKQAAQSAAALAALSFLKSEALPPSQPPPEE